TIGCSDRRGLTSSPENCEQTLDVFAAGGAVLEMSDDFGERLIDVLASQKRLHLPVPDLETGGAAGVAARGSEQPAQPFVAHVSLTSWPASARTLRSRRRASCSTLYTAPRVVPIRSATTSIGTSSTATARKTSRWRRVRASLTAFRSAVISSWHSSRC